MSGSASRRASPGKRDHAARAQNRERNSAPLPGASHLTRGQSPAPGALLLPHRVQPGEPSLISGHSASRVSPAAWALRRASLRGSPRPISGQVSPPERKSIPAGPGRAGGGSGASPLKSAARPAPRIPRHPPPAAGVPLDFLTCRDTVPRRLTPRSLSARPVRGFRRSSEPPLALSAPLPSQGSGRAGT